MSFLNRNSTSSQANQSTATSNTSTNTNIQPSGAGTVALGTTNVGGSFSLTNTTSDAATTANALKSNAALATHTIDAAKSFSVDSAALAKSLGNSAIDFASKTGSLVASNASDNLHQSLAFGENAFNTVDKALSQNADVFSGFQSTVSKLLGATQDTNAKAFQTVAESQSANVGLIDTTQTFVKYGVYAIGIVALAIALYASSKR